MRLQRHVYGRAYALAIALLVTCLGLTEGSAQADPLPPCPGPGPFTVVQQAQCYVNDGVNDVNDTLNIPLSELAQQAQQLPAGATASNRLPGPPVTIVIGGVNVPNGIFYCTFWLWGTASYNKAAVSIQDFEEGTAEGTTDCPGNNSLSVFQHVVDNGVGFLSTVHQTSNSSSGTNSAFIDVQQTVTLYTFPADWHAYGSLLEWTSKMHITPDPSVTLFGSPDLCVGYSALYGGGISFDGSGCP